MLKTLQVFHYFLLTHTQGIKPNFWQLLFHVYGPHYNPNPNLQIFCQPNQSCHEEDSKVKCCEGSLTTCTTGSHLSDCHGMIRIHPVGLWKPFLRMVLRRAWYFTEATKATASMPPGHCLGALEMHSRNLQFPHRVPFTNKKIAWCPLLFQKWSIQAWVLLVGMGDF